MKEVFWTTCSQPIWKCGCPDMPFLGTLKINFHNLNVVTIKLVIIFRVARQMKPGDCTTSFLSLSNCQRTLTDGRKCLNIWSWPLADLRNSNSNGKTNKRGPQMMNDSTKRCKRIFCISFGSLSLFSYWFWAAHSLFVWVSVWWVHLEDLLCKLDLGLAGQKIRHGRGIDTAIYGYICRRARHYTTEDQWGDGDVGGAYFAWRTMKPSKAFGHSEKWHAGYKGHLPLKNRGRRHFYALIFTGENTHDAVSKLPRIDGIDESTVPTCHGLLENMSWVAWKWVKKIVFTCLLWVN